MNTFIPLEIANTFLDKHGEEEGISHLKLQKLVYFVHGWWMAYKKHSVLSEKPEAWKYGPVFSSLYQNLKVYGNAPIKKTVKGSPFLAPPLISPKSTEIMRLIEWVWERYGHLSANALSRMAHKKGTAWQELAEKNNYVVHKGFRIPDNCVRKEFARYKKSMEIAL